MSDLVNDRLSKLERANRRLRFGMALLFGALVVAMTGGFGQDDVPPTDLVASSLTIVDADGNTTGWIGNEEQWGRIKLYHRNGETIFASTKPRPQIPARAEIPDPLTKEMIDAMTLQEVEVAVTKVASARQYAQLDEETRDRLKREFRMLIARMRDLKSDR